MSPLSINCTKVTARGLCMHHAAPRGWFSCPKCILAFPPHADDPRVIQGCALEVAPKRPLPPPAHL
jgi:hypothetical protein